MMSISMRFGPVDTSFASTEPWFVPIGGVNVSTRWAVGWSSPWPQPAASRPG